MAVGKRYHVGRFWKPTWQEDGNLVLNPFSENFNAGLFEAIGELDADKYIPCWSEAAHRPYTDPLHAGIEGNPIVNKVGQEIYEAIKGWGSFNQDGKDALNVEKGLKIIMLTTLAIFIYKLIKNR